MEVDRTIKYQRIVTLKPHVPYLNDWNADYAYNTQPLTGNFNINSCIMPNDYLLVNFNLPYKIAIRCKVTYLGHYKNAAIIDDTTTIIEPLVVIDKQESFEDFLTIFPNPNNGEFKVSCQEKIQQIKIYNDKGEIVLELSDLKSNTYNAKLNLESGSYLVQILTVSKIFINKKIIVL